MQVVFLGTGGYHPNERRHTACVLVPELGIAFDSGTAAFRLADYLTSDRLSVFLSHAHWDHIIGLTCLLVPLARGSLKQITVYGTRRTLDAVNDLLFAEPTFPVQPPFVYVNLDDTPTVALTKGATLTHWPQLSHPGGSTGFRIDWNENGDSRSLCYVTDTSVDGSYTDAIRGTDLLIHECYFPDAMHGWAAKTGHSTLSDVLTLAESASVKQLVLVHPDPQLASDDDLGLNQTAPCPFSVQLARDLDVVEV